MSGYKSLALASQAILFLSIFVHASLAVTNGNCPCSPNPTTTIVLYTLSAVYDGTNTNYTNYPVAGIQGTDFGSGQFGTVNVYDDPVTIAASPASTQIGRLQGIYALADVNGGGTLFATFTIQFTGGQYANSTLNINGLFTVFVNVPVQLAVVGGTNVFKNAIGNATLETVSRSGPNSILRAIINTREAV